MKLEFHKLTSLPLFTGIREEDLSAMLACLGSFQKRYRKNEIILLESNEVRSIGVILSGKVHMIKEDAEGYQTLLRKFPICTGQLSCCYRLYGSLSPVL